MPRQPSTVRRLTRRHFLTASALGAAGLGVTAACTGGNGSSAAAGADIPTVPAPSGKLTEARDAVLPPVSGERTLDLTLESRDVADHLVAANLKYVGWTYDGGIPGPVIHMRQGDSMNFRFVNNGALGHSIDFHAAQLD